jgi:hypothetical protein
MQIVDRRKLDENLEIKEPTAEDVAEKQMAHAKASFGKVLEIGSQRRAEPGAAKTTWRDVAFMIAFMNVNGQQVISGRCLGLRSDGRTFVADYLFSPVWERGLDWTAIAEDRLNTFLDCGCLDGTACEMHQKTCEAWLIEGVQRIQSVGAQGVPPAVEAFMKAQQQKPQIITPGR